MGDVMSLIERAAGGDLRARTRRRWRPSSARPSSRSTTSSISCSQVRKMTAGQGIAGLLGMLPGVGRQVKNLKVDERQVDRVEAIILSMTPAERGSPRIIDGSRRGASPRAAARSVQQVNQLLGQFEQIQKMMRQIGRGKMPQLPGLNARYRPISAFSSGQLAHSLKEWDVAPPTPGASAPPHAERVRLCRVPHRRGPDAEDATSEVFARALRYKSSTTAPRERRSRGSWASPGACSRSGRPTIGTPSRMCRRLPRPERSRRTR